VNPLDPFDLPDWLGDGEVTWTSDDVTRSGALVAGCLLGSNDARHACDLLAVDQAYPAPVVDDRIRTAAHQAWRHGQVLLVDRDGRATLAVPGTAFTADTVLDAVTRLAKAVGVAPSSYSVRLRLGGH
jgi:hypothetical protein